MDGFKSEHDTTAQRRCGHGLMCASSTLPRPAINYDNIVIHANRKKSKIAGYTARKALESSSLVPPKKLMAAVSRSWFSLIIIIMYDSCDPPKTLQPKHMRQMGRRIHSIRMKVAINAAMSKGKRQ